jgi:hypothetical protein
MVKEHIYSRKVRDIDDLEDRIQTVISSILLEMYVRVLVLLLTGFCVLNTTGNS